ncbi:hypothetical protein ABZ135_30350 [Streptomyces sp. NPDC006339]
MIIGQVVDFLGIPDDVPAGVAKRMRRQPSPSTLLNLIGRGWVIA